ncbi:hypothetical protein OSH11_11065 [Kaistia dalseonensis]|uniref:Uncharacterized protein n=1 Tax=Kaistia dalseonensis TaxID=410840 RepID=A0ABU0H8K1_9HYPH|nr:hypothetical protein [Kaistia dalseonensis]MCX5495248.1 hypothetical protein [Kaistia dalseonensis]MDQ0437834.1 hypothetical protein [Kaistia dalseonensis]
MATRLPCGMMCRYLDRLPERLVVEGFRRWMQGCDRGSVACWEMAANLFTEEFGLIEGHRMLGELVQWVDALRAGMDHPADLSPYECPRLCRDECVAVAMIAASQSGDAKSLSTAVNAFVRPEARDATMRAAQAFAHALAETGLILIPVPDAVIRDVAEWPGRQQFH